MQVHIDKMDKMSVKEWNEVVTARIQTFIVESMRPFQVLDEYDQPAYHLRLITDDGHLAGYARLYTDHNQRVILDQFMIVADYRGQGVGKQFLQMAIFTSKRLFPSQQLYLITDSGMEDFYLAMGFSINNRLQRGRILLKKNG